MKGLKMILALLAAVTLLAVVAPQATATDFAFQRQAFCAPQAVVQQYVVPQQVIVQQQYAVPLVQRQIVQQRVVQRNVVPQRIVTRQRIRGGGSFSSLSIQRQRSGGLFGF